MNFRPNSKFWNLFSDLFVDPNFAQSAYLDLALEVLESREMLSADITGLSLLQDTGVANDGYTTTPVIVATVNNTTANASLKLEVDANNDGIADYSRELGTFSAGTYQFEFDSSSFVLTDKFGQQNNSYRIVAQTAASGSISSQWQAYTYNWVDEQTQLTFHATEGSVSLINAAAQTEILQINDLRQGVAVPADAVGVGYFMYSAANLANRFSANPPAANTAANIAVVRYNGESNTWEYTDGQAWHTFQVHATDRLLAIADLSARITRRLTGDVGEIFGIKQGFTDSDISIVSNQFGGSVSEGNYQVFGSYVRTKPSLAESQPSFEFGQVSQGSQLTRTLTIKNVFDHAIDVVDVGLPLGFSAPGFAPGVLLPGQSMNIVLRLDGIFPGDASGAIGINTVANEVESVQILKINAAVTAPAMMLEYAGEPLETQLDWGVLASGQTVSREILVRNTGVGVLSLGSIVVPAGFVVTAPLSSTTLSAGQSATFTVSFTGGTVALNSGLLQVLPNEGGLPLKILRLTAEVDVPRLSVRVADGPWSHSGDQITFGTVLAGQSLSRSLVLKNNGVAALEIGSLDVPAGIQVIGFNSPITLQAGQSVSLQVVFASTAGTQINDTLVINSNDPNDAEFSIDISAVALGPSLPALLNPHGTSPGISNDPRILVTLSPTEFLLAPGTVRAHVDTNGDGVADESFTLTSTNFIYDPLLPSDGSFTRSIRFEIIDPVTENSVLTSWQSITAIRDSSIVDQPASIVSLTRAGDNVSGQSMMSAVIEGVVANDGSFLDLLVQVDFNEDGIVDGVTTVRPDGTFRFEAFGIALGEHRWIVTVREFPYQSAARTSEPVAIDFNLVAYPAPAFVSFGLQQDTGSSNTDRITSKAIIDGALAVSGSDERYRVYWDSTANGEFLDWVSVDTNGNFELDFSRLGIGSHTIYMKSYDTLKNVESSVVSLAVQLTSIETPEIVSFSLVGGVQANGTTNDVALHGTITSEWGIANRQIQFDIDGDGLVDQVVYTDSNGYFQFAPRTLGFGTHTVRARSSAFDPMTESEVFGQWSAIEFNYQKSLSAHLSGFALTGNNGSNQVVDPLISGTVLINGAVGRYVEVEFDYDGDGVADGFAVTDFFGAFTHFADTKVGVETTVRARVRSLDANNNQYIYGSYQQITFTRVAGQPRLASEDLTGIASASQSHSSRVWDALNFAVDGLKTQFNGSGGGPSGGGTVGGGGDGGMGAGGGTGGGGTGGGTDYFVTGFNVAGVSLALATANSSFGVTPVDEFSFQNGHESRYILMGNAPTNSVSGSGSYTFAQNNGYFSVVATMTYTVTVDMSGSLNFSYTMGFTFTSGDESISGGASGAFSKTMMGAVGFSETLFLNGTVHADSYYFTTDYLSSIGITGGQVNSNGSVSYGLSRTETLNNSAGFTRIDGYGTITGTASQTGTYNETILATNIGSTGGAVQKTFNRDFQTELESTETYQRQHSADGFVGTESRTRTDNYTIDRDETGGMLRANGLWTVGETQFHYIWNTASSVSASVNGTFSDPIGHQSILLGAVSPDSTSTNNLTTYAVNSTGSRIDTVNYDIEGEFNLQTGINADFTWQSSSDAELNLSLVTNSPPNVVGDQTTLTVASLTYELQTEDSFGLTGTFAEFGTTLTIIGTGTTTNDTNLLLNNQSVTTTTSPSLYSRSSRQQTLDSSSTTSNNYTFSTLTPDHTGSYTITQTTVSQLILDEEVEYNNHQLQAVVNYQHQSATLNGSATSMIDISASSLLTESGDYSATGSVTTTTGTFSKTFAESTHSTSQSDLTYVTALGNYESIESNSLQDSVSNQADSGTFSSTEHGDPVLDSRTVSGNYLNTASTAGSTWMRIESYELMVVQGNPVVVTRLESYEVETTTDFDSQSAEGGNYTSVDTLLSDSRSGSGWHTEASNSTSTTNFSQTRAAGNWTITSTNNVTTESESASGGTYTETATSITHDDWYETSSISDGTHTTTVLVRGDGYGSTSITSSEFGSGNTDAGTVTGTRAKVGAGSTTPLTKSGEFSLSSYEINDSYYHDYSHVSGGGLTVDSNSVTYVTSNVDNSESGTYYRGSDGIMTRNGSFSSTVSSATASLSLFSMSFHSGGRPVLENDGTTSKMRDTYSSQMTRMTLDNTNNSRTTNGTTTSVTPVNGVEFETAQGTFTQNYFGSTFSVSTSVSSATFARGSMSTDDLSIDSGSIFQADTNGTFSDNGTDTTETMTRQKVQTEGSSQRSILKYNIEEDTGRTEFDSTQWIHSNSTYTEDATLTERELANGIRENVLNVGSFTETSNQTVTENATTTVDTDRKLGVISQEVDGDDFYTRSGLSIITSHDVAITNNQMTSNEFTKGVFNNVGADHDRIGKFTSTSTLENYVNHTESGTGQTNINGEVSFTASSGRGSYLYDAKMNGRFRSTSLAGESHTSHTLDMISSEISRELQNGGPTAGAGDGTAFFIYAYNKDDSSRRTGTVTDDSVRYTENTVTNSFSSTSSYWIDFRESNHTDAEILGEFIGSGVAKYLPTILRDGFISNVDWWTNDVDLTGWTIGSRVLDTRTTNSSSRSHEERQTTGKSRLGGALSTASQSTGGSNEVVPTFSVSLEAAHEGFSINRQEQTTTQSKSFGIALAGQFTRTSLFRSATSYGQRSETRNQTLEYTAGGNGTGSAPSHAQYSNYEIHRNSSDIGKNGDTIYYSLKTVSGSTVDQADFEDNDYFDGGLVNTGLAVTNEFQPGTSIVHRDSTKDAYRDREHYEWFDKDTAPPDNPDAPEGWDGTDYGRSRRIDQTWGESGRTWENIEGVGSEKTSHHTVWRTPTHDNDLYYYHSNDYSNTERNKSTVDWANPYFYWESDSRSETLARHLDSTKNYHTITDPPPSTWLDEYQVAEFLFWWDEAKEWVLDRLSEALDVLSLVADVFSFGTLGGIFDLMNAGISYARGNYGEAALDLAAAVPFVGLAATGAKYLGKATQAVAKASKHVGNVASMTKMTKGIGNTVKTGGKTMGTGAQVAKRSGDAGSAAKRSQAARKNTQPDSCPDPKNNQCFVGDTKVLIFAEVPEEIIANWAPVPLDPAQARSRNVLGMWFSLSAVGVVVAIGLRAVRGKDEEDVSNNRRQRAHHSLSGPSSSGIDDEASDGHMLGLIDDGHSIEHASANSELANSPAVPPRVTADELAAWAEADVSQYLGTEYWDGQSLANEQVRTLSFKIIQLPQASQTPAPLPQPAIGHAPEPAPGPFTRRSLPITEILSSALRSEPSHSVHHASKVCLAAAEELSSKPSRWRVILDWPHWTTAMWISLLLCMGTWIGFAWLDSPTNTAIMPAGEVGSRSVADRSAAMLQHLQLGHSKDGMTLAQVPIRDIKVGTRAPAFNPEVTAKERASWIEPRWEEWLCLSLLMPKDDGTNLEIEILRPEWWIVQQFQFHYEEPTPFMLSRCEPYQWSSATNPADDEVYQFTTMEYFSDLGRYAVETESTETASDDAASSAWLPPLRPAYYELAVAGLLAELAGLELVGATVEMDLPELGAVGPALVVDLKPCPAIPAGPGQVITATFKHASADVMDLVLSDYPVATLHSGLSVSDPSTTDTTSSTETIGVTGNHPFWSLDRLEFVQVGELAIGERLQTLSGDTKWVQQKLPRPGPEPVYNLEVQGEHVYYVGTDGVLAHNASCWDEGKGKWVWGKSFQDALVRAGDAIPKVLIALGKRLHGHHIVMRGVFSGWLNGSRKYVVYSQKVLKAAGINIHDKRNLAHAVNEAHSKAYAKAVATRLQDAVKDAKKDGDLTGHVSSALEEMKKILHSGGKFW